MASATKLVRIRGGHRSECTRLIEKITQECISEVPEKNKLLQWKIELCRQRDRILELDSRILEIIEEDSIDDDVAGASEVSIAISECLEITSKCISMEPVSKDEVMQNMAKNVKLPTITLPTFRGAALEWQHFWDLYRGAIHNRTDISEAAKFHYLQSQLVGEASQLMQGFNHTNAEYAEAVKLLEETYGKPSKQIEAHIHAILDLGAPKSSAKALSKFRSIYEGHLRGLRTLEVQVDDAGFLFTEILLRKLPPEVRDRINRENRKDTWDLTSLRNAISTEVDYLQSIGKDDTSVELSSSDEMERSEYVKSTMTMTTSTRNGFQRKCSFCGSPEHSATLCKIFSTPDSRRAQVMKKKLCFNCLRPGSHQASQCSSRSRCRRCTRKHHTALCSGDQENFARRGYKPMEAERGAWNNKKEEDSRTPILKKSAKSFAKESTSTVMTGSHKGSSCTSVLPTALLTVENGAGKFRVRALFDSGSQKSFILNKITDGHEMEFIREVELSISGFGGEIAPQLYNVVKFNVLIGSERVPVEAIVVPKLPENLHMPGRSRVVKMLKGRGINLADGTDDSDHFTDISILIGADFYYKFVYSNTIDDIALIESKVGYLMSGTIPATISEQESQNVKVVTVLRVEAVENDIDATLRKFWELEAIGMTPPPVTDSISNKVLDECVQFDGQQFVAKLPWRDYHQALPSNYSMARGRLNKNLIDMRSKPQILLHYDRVIKEQLERGFIEEVPCPEEFCGKLHYIAHHGVIKESTTTPLRVVFDCAAKVSKGKPSLNDCLQSGPSLANEMVSVLHRFRAHPFASVADIEKAYLMIRLHEDDRDSSRFFWPRDVWDPSSEFLVYRFCTVFFGATCSQFLLNLSLRKLLQGTQSKCAAEIGSSLYVDNIAYSARTETDLRDFYEGSTTLLASAGFRLRAWATNSDVVNRLIVDDKVSIMADEACNKDINVLGIKWNADTDRILLNIKLASVNEKCTKRIILKECAKLFDPLGLILPVSIRARFLMQELWLKKVSWDEQLQGEVVERWIGLSKDIALCNNVSIDRSLNISESLMICAFCDASQRAYGTVVYIKSDNGIRFVMAKARVVPIKAPSLPQLELTAANTAARLVCFVRDSFLPLVSNCEIHIWTDSMIVLSWLQSAFNSKQYVRQRVQNIQELLPEAQWHFVKGTENPADLLTRGISANSLADSKLWWQGPDWLPVFRNSLECERTNINFVNSDINHHVESAIESEIVISSHSGITEGLSNYLERFSSYKRLLRVTAYVLRFVNNLRLCGRSYSPEDGGSRVLSVHEVDSAELLLIKLVQRAYYPDVFSYLETGRGTIPPVVRQLRVDCKGGVLRCFGRLSASRLPYDAKYPFLLPTKSHFTTLVIAYTHHRYLHAGVSHVLSALRERFWIPCGRQRVKSALRKCLVCKRHSAKLMEAPSVAPLPDYRVVESKPFSATGVDYTGALLVKERSKCIKVYVCLFTCMVTRAVHLELVEDSSAPTFMRAFRRFTARRSCPSYVLSDNAKIFKSAAVDLRKISSNSCVTNYLSEFGIQWKFIPARAPHFGGVWERMIGITKKVLLKVLGRALVAQDELRTLLCEVEAIVNDRPLTHVSDCIEDEPLTPSHLLAGFRIKSLGNCGFDPAELHDPSVFSDCVFGKRELRLRSLLDGFWKRWKEEYLKSLRERDRLLVNSNVCPVSLGDVVLIHDEKSRSVWNLGRIIELHPGRDGIVRFVTLKTKNGKTTRPIVKLVHLEIHSDYRDTGIDELNDSNHSGRPVRDAAAKARGLISRGFAENSI